VISIKRDSGYADRLRAYQIVLDGQTVGELRNGEELKLGASPGRHQLYVKIDWCRSPIVDFDDDGGLVSFDCGSSLRGWRLFLVLLYVVLFRHDYLWLRRR